VRRAAGAAGIAAAMLPGSPGLAQEGDPIVINPQRQLEGFVLTDLQAAVEFDWRRQVDEFDPADGTDEKTTEDRLREILEVGGRGYLGHPNLAELNLLGRLWFTQRRFDSDQASRAQHSDEIFYEYDVSALLLKKQKIPTTIYSRRNQTDIDRQFSGTLENTWTETGVRFNIRDTTFPTNIQIYRREQEQDDPSFGQDFSIDQDSIEADGQVDLGKAQDLWWDYSYDDVTQRGSNRIALDFDRQEANLNHLLLFGGDLNHQLRSNVRFYEETGDLDFRNVRVNERLRFRHSNQFTTWFEFEENRLERNSVDQNGRRASANLRHQLFESLLTTARVGATWLELPDADFDSDLVFADLVMDYTKRLPLGVLSGGPRIVYRERDDSDRGVPLSIFDQPFTFGIDDLIIIDQRNILPASIFITDATGLIVYAENIDYTVMGFPDRVELRRIVSGNIGQNEVILVDYEIGPEPGSETTTRGLGFTSRYSFDQGPLAGFSVYANYFDQDENRRSDEVGITLVENDFTNLRYGAEYEFWKIYLQAEQEIRDSTLFSFETTRAEARYTNRLGRGSALVLSFNYQEVDRTDENLVTETFTCTGQWTQQFSTRLRSNLTVQWRRLNERGGAGVDSDAFEGDLEVLWRYRQTEAFAILRTSYVDSDTDDTWFQTFHIGVRREF
jgi:hypothetical protein